MVWVSSEIIYIINRTLRDWIKIVKYLLIKICNINKITICDYK